MNYIIRNEEPKAYRAVEELTKRAFWNVNMPGCNEHFLLHEIRQHSDFIKELDFVIEVDNKIVASIIFTRATLTNEKGEVKDVLSFGPISVDPDYQRKGYGKALMAHTFLLGKKLGYPCVVIFGHPSNYVSSGFKCCKRFSVCLEGDLYPTALLVQVLDDKFFDGKRWYYKESPAFEIDESRYADFDKDFPQMVKQELPGQEEFYIYSKSQVLW
ncbi:MAG: N-acetyltransferase [Treponema sp.]|nr:N-acetyltransferase [Treponema sp.]